MNLNEVMHRYANEIGGTYSDYDSTKSIIIVPLKDDRFQTVLGHVKFLSHHNKKIIELRSKVCEFDNSIDMKELLEMNTELVHAKFAISDGTLQVEASVNIENISEQQIKEIIQEVAITADEYEFKLTGQDVN
ncbi:MAG TPA: hypothetical protein PKC24_13525 [Cyclobacteriaceae bacterium]|nr:hypothetical protein [Cyclobacteriaceae bacterium]